MKYPKHVIEHALRLHEEGLLGTEIAKSLEPFHPSPATVTRWIARSKQGPRVPKPGVLGNPWWISQAVANVKVTGCDAQVVADELGIRRDLVVEWVKKYFDPDTMAEMAFDEVVSTIMDTMSKRNRKKSQRNTVTRKRSREQRMSESPAPLFNEHDPSPAPGTPLPPAPEGARGYEDYPFGQTIQAGEVMFNGRKVAEPLRKQDLPDDIDELKRMLQDERFYRAAAESAVVVLGKDVAPVTNGAKTQMTQLARSAGYATVPMLRYYQLPKATYYRHHKRLDTVPIDKWDEVRKEIKQICEGAKEGLKVAHYLLGYRKVKQELVGKGIQVGEKKIREIMVEEHLGVVQRSRYKYSSYQGELTEAPDNLLFINETGEVLAPGGASKTFRQFNAAHPDAPLTHDFHADGPYQRLVTDISELRCRDGKLYISPLIDLWDRDVISCAVGFRPTSHLVQTMLEDGLSYVPAGTMPLIHTDRGVHYRTHAWIEASEGRFIRSMSRKGNSGDNAGAEGFFGLLKKELGFIRGATHTMTRAEVISLLDNWIDWYRYRRLHSRLGHRTIAEHRGWSIQDNYNLAA